jgi:hypothetical protein
MLIICSHDFRYQLPANIPFPSKRKKKEASGETPHSANHASIQTTNHAAANQQHRHLDIRQQAAPKGKKRKEKKKPPPKNRHAACVPAVPNKKAGCPSLHAVASRCMRTGEGQPYKGNKTADGNLVGWLQATTSRNVLDRSFWRPR